MANLENMPKNLRTGGGVFIITGANAGVGFETCRQLSYAQDVTKIILACRSISKCEKAISQLVEQTGKSESLYGSLALDTSDNKSARAAVESLVTAGEKIDGILMNAGGFVNATCSNLTPSGCTMLMAVNVVGHMVLTEGLNDAKMFAPGARIVISASEAAMGMASFAHPEFEAPYANCMARHMNNTHTGKPELEIVGPGPMGDSGYPYVKSFGILYLQVFAKKNPHLYVSCLSPGATRGTEMMKDSNFLMKQIVVPIVSTLMTHPVHVGAARYLQGLIGADIEKKHPSGTFLGSENYQKPIGMALIDLGTLNDHFNMDKNTELREAAYEAVRRYMEDSPPAAETTPCKPREPKPAQSSCTIM